MDVDGKAVVHIYIYIYICYFPAKKNPVLCTVLSGNLVIRRTVVWGEGRRAWLVTLDLSYV